MTPLTLTLPPHIARGVQDIARAQGTTAQALAEQACMILIVGRPTIDNPWGQGQGKEAANGGKARRETA